MGILVRGASKRRHAMLFLGEGQKGLLMQERVIFQLIPRLKNIRLSRGLFSHSTCRGAIISRQSERGAAYVVLTLQ